MNVRPPYGSAFPPPMSQAQPPSEPSFRERIERYSTLTRRALQYWKVAAVIVVLGMAASLAAARSVKFVYRSECTVLFRPGLRGGAQNQEGGVSEKTLAAKLKDGLLARTRLEGVIKQFKLYPKVVESRGMVDAVEEMRLHIGFRARDSETFVISFEAEDAEVARQVTENLADSMIQEYESTSLSAAQREAEFLTKQEQRSTTELDTATKSLATFLTIHPEFLAEARTTAFAGAAGGGAGGAAAGGQPVPHTTPIPTTSDTQLAVLYRQRARLQEEVRNNGKAAAPGPAANPGGESIAKLTVQRDQAAKAAATAAGELADRRTHLTDEHPDVISAKVAADTAARTLHQAEMALAAAQTAQAGQGPNPYEAPPSDADVQRRISQLNGEIAARQDAVRHQAAANPSIGADAGQSSDPAMVETNELVQLETDWQRLLGTVHDVRVEHDDLKQRLERARLAANAAEASGGDQMMVVDPAYKPLTPSKGGRTKTALAGGTATLLIAFAYLLARVLSSDTIIDSADIEAMRLIPMLGVVPKLRSSNPPNPPAPARKGNPRVV